MFSEANKIQRERPPNVNLGGKEQTAAGSVAPVGFYQLSLTTRSENPGEDGLIYRTVIPSSPCNEDLVEDVAVKRKRHHMTPQNYLISKRSRADIAEGERKGIDERENVAPAPDKSDSALKVSSGGDSDLTAERMAEGSSRTSSSDNGCSTMNLDAPPTTTDAPRTFCDAAIRLSFINSSQATEKFQGTSSDSNVKSNIEDGQAVYRPQVFSSTSKTVCEDEERWLDLGLGSGHRSHQAKQSSNKQDTDIISNVKGSILSWNKVDCQQQMYSTGHTTKLTTSLPPSSSVQAAPLHQFSLNSLALHNNRIYTNTASSRPFQQDNMGNKLSLQKNTTDCKNLSTLSLLQPFPIEDLHRSQNIAGCSAVPASVDHNFKLMQWQTGETSSTPSKEATWRGFYDRIAEDGIAGGTDPCFSEPRIHPFFQGSQNIFQGWNGFSGKRSIPGSAGHYQNFDSDASVNLPDLAARVSQDAAVLQQAILDKLQSRTHWNNKDNMPLWSKAEINQGAFFRPSSSDIPARKIPPTDRTPTSRQLYDQHARTERNVPDTFGELQKSSSLSFTEHARICRSSRSAQTGVWFMLQALNDQSGDRVLPQIPRNFLRIKDGTMTILVLKKYLVNKLGLNSESEIEISCKGQQLLPSLTLQYVRDVMWSSSFKDDQISARNIASNNYTSMDHLMVLHYRRKPVEVVTSLL